MHGVSANDTVLELKKRIIDQLGLWSDAFTSELSKDGQFLQPNQRLSKYNFKDVTLVCLVESAHFAGGPASLGRTRKAGMLHLTSSRAGMLKLNR